MNRKPATPADVLGVPSLPLGQITNAGNRVRRGLGRLHGAVAPPPVRILEGLFGILEHRALVVLCRAGVPDALTRPTAVPQLAGRLGVEPVRLERLLRYAATKGWVRLDRRGRVHPTGITAFLRSDHPGRWRAWVEFAGGEEIVTAIGALSVDEDAPDAFATVNGAPFFDWMAQHPDRWSTFDRAMGAGTLRRRPGWAYPPPVGLPTDPHRCDTPASKTSGVRCDRPQPATAPRSQRALTRPRVAARRTR